MEQRGNKSWWKAGLDGALILSSAVIAVCVWMSVAAAWHWPLVGDEALMHYVVFLMRHGFAPYSQIVDINLPGSYLLDSAAMRAFGGGAVGLRIYDGLLCLAVWGAGIALSRPGWRGRLLGCIAGALFVLIHLRDGVGQAGQRDLAMAAIALLAFVILLRSPGGAERGRCLRFSFSSGSL